MRPATPPRSIVGTISCSPSGWRQHAPDPRLGEFKRSWAGDPAYLVRATPRLPVAALFLRRHVPGLGWLWLRPQGAGRLSVDQLSQMLASGAPPGCLLASGWSRSWPTPGNRLGLTSLGLRKAEDVQISRATAIVDLAPDEDAPARLLQAQDRYNIRLAGRRGVTGEPVPCDAPGVTAMYGLMAAAFERADYPSAQATTPLLAALRGERPGSLFLARLGRRCWRVRSSSTSGCGPGTRTVFVHTAARLMPPHSSMGGDGVAASAGSRSYDLFRCRARSSSRPATMPSGGSCSSRRLHHDIREFSAPGKLVLDSVATDSGSGRRALVSGSAAGPRDLCTEGLALVPDPASSPPGPACRIV